MRDTALRRQIGHFAPAAWTYQYHHVVPIHILSSLTTVPPTCAAPLNSDRLVLETNRRFPVLLTHSVTEELLRYIIIGFFTDSMRAGQAGIAESSGRASSLEWISS